ncbi:2Fe-2S iron-sulfur cluster-binding protein [Yonghaparkia sp. Root332]|uniref:2Fe-2S iron-sulfur cluster-binding protein n=1 Tax=Yonghaparkia sp. Root332 TaxID=1736516 RepID=UPI000B0E1893|nr:2Fe-2S iron-sulfur cluster-binding protein [Yonghaparkia sp. Root332]
MTDPHLWWYVTRISAMLAWIVMTIAVLWGIVLSTRIFRGADNPAWLQDLHRFLGGTAVVLTILHAVSLMLDPWLSLTPLEALVPFVGDFKPLPVALGIVSFYVLVAVQSSSLLKDRLPRRVWRGIHLSSYVAVLAVAFHAGAAGTDRGTWWYQAVATVLITATVLAAIVRLIMAGRRSGERPAPSHPIDPRTRTRMRVVALDDIADGVRRIRLAPADGSSIEPWEAGAHITVVLPDGVERQYSLCSDPADRDHLDIAVRRVEPAGHGSAWIHSTLAPGDELEVVGPRCTFPLRPAHRYLFIAGGIGITPLKAMIAAVPPQRDWRLVYVGRSRASMPFADELERTHPGRVRVVARDEREGRLPLTEILADDAEVYACGPTGLLDELERLVPADRLHLERFVAVDRSSGRPSTPFAVRLARSQRILRVPADESMLHALQRSGVAVPTSCGTGVCGTCETRVVAGVPDHRDSVMSDADKDEIGVVYPCVSRASSAELVLDL